MRGGVKAARTVLNVRRKITLEAFSVRKYALLPANVVSLHPEHDRVAIEVELRCSGNLDIRMGCPEKLEDWAARWIARNHDVPMDLGVVVAARIVPQRVIIDRPITN